MRPNTGQQEEQLVHCTARDEHRHKKNHIIYELTMVGVECKDSTLTQTAYVANQILELSPETSFFVTTQLVISLTLLSTTTTTSIIQ